MPHLDLRLVAPGKKAPINTPKQATVTASSSGSNLGSGGPAGIPTYAQARWIPNFLPTLYSNFGTLPNPWDLPGGDVAYVQKIYDEVYPTSGYLVALGCPVYNKVSSRYDLGTLSNLFYPQVKDRMNSRRSLFGTRGQTVVDNYFQTKEFQGNPKLVAKYAKWALRDDGAGIWGKPSPMGIKRGEPGYTVRPFSTDLYIDCDPFAAPRPLLYL